MLRRVLSLLPLLAASTLGCDATGGATDPILPPTPSFTVLARSPEGGRAGVPVSALISVTFSASIDPATVRIGSLTVNGRSAGELHVSGASLTFAPSGGLDSGTTYAIALSPDLAGKNGIVLGPYAEWGFKTVGTPPTRDTVLLVRPRR